MTTHERPHVARLLPGTNRTLESWNLRAGKSREQTGGEHTSLEQGGPSAAFLLPACSLEWFLWKTVLKSQGGVGTTRLPLCATCKQGRFGSLLEQLV